MQDFQTKLDRAGVDFDNKFSSIIEEKNAVMKDYEKALKKAKSHQNII